MIRCICEPVTSDTTSSCPFKRSNAFYSFYLQNLFSGTRVSVFVRLGKKMLGLILRGLR